MKYNLYVLKVYGKGGKTLYKIGYSSKILDAHGDSYKELIFQLRRQFKVGRHPTREINKKLQKVYDANNLNRRAKSSDMYEIFGENRVKPYNTGGERGFEVLN